MQPLQELGAFRGRSRICDPGVFGRIVLRRRSQHKFAGLAAGPELAGQRFSRATAICKDEPRRFFWAFGDGQRSLDGLPAHLVQQGIKFLPARAIGPVVVQGVTSSAAWTVEHGEGGDGDGDGDGARPGDSNRPGDGNRPLSEGNFAYMVNTCHVWAEDGPGQQKIAAGWRPGKLEYPAPSVVEIRRRLAQDPEPGAPG